MWDNFDTNSRIMRVILAQGPTKGGRVDGGLQPRWGLCLQPLPRERKASWRLGKVLDGRGHTVPCSVPGPKCYCQSQFGQSQPRNIWAIVDGVRVPGVAGDFVLRWLWDTEQNPQICSKSELTVQ